MPPGNKAKTFIGNPAFKSPTVVRNIESATKKKRVKRSAKKKSVTKKESIRCVSPLVYNPEEALKELMEKYYTSPEDLHLNELRELELDNKRSQRIAVRMGLSNDVSRFEIPMDVKMLENMSVQEYLRNYCRVCKRRQTYYKKFFDKFDKDKDGFLSAKEMEQALKEVYFNEINYVQVQDLMFMISAEENTIFDSKLFISLCAFSERLFYATFVRH
ncbi:uncharacterized protein O3C94_001370 isoform 2-T3 [Discoglossus pictus]